MTNPVRTIAIDGPVASGKSTLGFVLAQRLGYLYLDTGVMYRALALAALQAGVPTDDEAQLEELLQHTRIEVQAPNVNDGRRQTVLLNGQDVSWEVYQPQVERHVSRVAAFPAIRRAMVREQRRIAAAQPVVMVGRDIGTVVMPDADLKIYLRASTEARAQRRYHELRARGQRVELADVMQQLRQRDAQDTERADSPLQPAADAVILDNTALNVEETLQRVWTLIVGRTVSEH
ncbi:MAG: (d)CMP kinase [Thermoflexales bacterium]